MGLQWDVHPNDQLVIRILQRPIHRSVSWGHDLGNPTPKNSGKLWKNGWGFEKFRKIVTFLLSFLLVPRWSLLTSDLSYVSSEKCGLERQELP